MPHSTLVFPVCGRPSSSPPFPEHVESVLQSKPLNGVGEEGGMCVLISRKYPGVGGIAASSGDVSPQMGLAGRWSRAGCCHNHPSCARGEEPAAVGGAGENHVYLGVCCIGWDPAGESCLGRAKRTRLRRPPASAAAARAKGGGRI